MGWQPDHKTFTGGPLYIHWNTHGNVPAINLINDYGGGESNWAIRTNDLLINDFDIKDVHNNAIRMYINNSGNVGIGTTTTMNRPLVIGPPGATATHGIQIRANDVNWYLDARGTDTNNIFQIGNDSLAVVNVTTAGNVGIGTVSPSGPLEVSGSGPEPLFVSRTGTHKWAWGIDSISMSFIDVTDGWTEPFAIYNNGGVSIGADYGGATVPTNGLAVEGSVGIGVTGPLTKLDVNGTIAFHFSGIGSTGSPNETVAFRAYDAPNQTTFASINMFNTWQNDASEWMSFNVRNGAGTKIVAETIDANGRHGIGTTAPSGVMEIQGAVPNLVLRGSTVNAAAALDFYNVSSTAYPNWRIANLGNVVGGLEITPSTANSGTTFTNPAVMITPTQFLVPSVLSQAQSGRAMYVASNGLFTCNTSDERAKTNIVTISDVLDKLQELRGVYFNWDTSWPYTANQDPTIRHLGMIAQEVEKVFPEVVDTSSTPPYDKAIDYAPMVGFLIEVNKAQQGEISSLQSTVSSQSTVITSLEGQVSDLNSRLSRIEAMLAAKAVDGGIDAN